MRFQLRVARARRGLRRFHHIQQFPVYTNNGRMNREMIDTRSWMASCANIPDMAILNTALAVCGVSSLRRSDHRHGALLELIRAFEWRASIILLNDIGRQQTTDIPGAYF